MRRNQQGFTLLEIMIVLVIVGIMFSAVIPNIRGSDPADEVERHSKAFLQMFTLASEFALLNNLELGLHVEENTYQFLAFDGQKWVAVPEQDVLTEVTLNEPLSIELSLDDLPIEDDVMQVSQSLFEDMDFDEGFSEDEKPIYPQVYILSGGDITPFKMTFTYDDNFSEPVFFNVLASYTLPLELEGPFNDDR